MSVTVFGGGAVQTAYVSFTDLDITLNDITLVWPTSYFDVPSVVGGIHYNVLAASMTVNDGNVNTHKIILPNATESSVGSNFIITNIGLSSFQLMKADGVTELIVIPNVPNTSNSFWVQLIDNSTPNGDWQFVQFGAGTSQAQASALAGNGLVALGGLLNTNIVVQAIPNAPYQVLLTDRAKLLLWQTGNGNLLLPAIATPIPNGFYISVNNEGSGSITISCVDGDIDNIGSISVAPGQSLSIISNGVNWWTLGFGQNIASSHFASGSAIAPSITFTSDITTGIYYYNTVFPPVTPPGIGFSVSSSQIANINSSGLYMNSGNDITVQDQTSVAETKLQSNASYGRITWSNTGLVNVPTLDITGTDTESSLTLGPFGTFKIEQNDLIVAFTYELNNFLIVTDTAALFPVPVAFSQTVTLNGALVCNNTATFNASVTLAAPAPLVCNGTANFNAAVTLGAAAPIICNGTSQFNGSVTLGVAAPLVCNAAAQFDNVVSFSDDVTFQNTSDVTLEANLVCNDSATFNGEVTLADPLSIASGGTGQNNQASAIKALLPAAPPIGSMIYYDHTGNWIVVSPGIITNTLQLVDDGLGNPVPKWV